MQWLTIGRFELQRRPPPSGMLLSRMLLSHMNIHTHKCAMHLCVHMRIRIQVYMHVYLYIRIFCSYVCMQLLTVWPLHDIAIANIVWCMPYKGGVGRGVVIAQVDVQ